MPSLLPKIVKLCYAQQLASLLAHLDGLGYLAEPPWEIGISQCCELPTQSRCRLQLLIIVLQIPLLLLVAMTFPF